MTNIATMTSILITIKRTQPEMLALMVRSHLT